MKSQNIEEQITLWQNLLLLSVLNTKNNDSKKFCSNNFQNLLTHVLKKAIYFHDSMTKRLSLLIPLIHSGKTFMRANRMFILE